MKLLCAVDQRAAFGRGIDAPGSTVELEITPAELSEQERELVCVLLVNGRDLTRLGLDADGRVSPTAEMSDRVRLSNPSVEGLREELSRLILVREPRLSATAKRTQERRDEASQRLAEYMDSGPIQMETPAHLNELTGAEVGSCDESQLVRYAGFAVPAVDWDGLSPEDTEKLKSEQSRRSGLTCAARDAAVQAAVPALLAAKTARERLAAEAQAEAERLAAEEVASGKVVIVNGNRRKVMHWVVDDGCTDCPAPDRGTSWLATVSADRHEKSGLARQWWERAQVGWRKIPASLAAGDYIEYGQKDRKGRPQDYDYYRVLAVSAGTLIVRAAGKPRSKPPPVGPEIEAAKLTAPAQADGTVTT